MESSNKEAFIKSFLLVGYCLKLANLSVVYSCFLTWIRVKTMDHSHLSFKLYKWFAKLEKLVNILISIVYPQE